MASLGFLFPGGMSVPSRELCRNCWISLGWPMRWEGKVEGEWRNALRGTSYSRSGKSSSSEWQPLVLPLIAGCGERFAEAIGDKRQKFGQAKFCCQHSGSEGVVLGCTSGCHRNARPHVSSSRVLAASEGRWRFQGF